MQSSHWVIPHPFFFLAALTIASPSLAQGSTQKLLDGKFAADAPGGVVAIVKDGVVRSVHARGVSIVGEKTVLSRKARFYLASVSKQLTAACVHLLAHQKKLSLDADVREIIPELPDYGDEITVRHLIHHRSGLRDIFELMVLAKMDIDAAHSMATAIELVARQKELNFRPGSEFLYSNSGYLLLAEIVARVSKQSLREFARDHLFGPLGMKDSCFRDRPGEQLPDAVLGHDATRSGFRKRPTKFHLVGSGGAVASIDDLCRWVVAMDRGKLVSGEFVTGLQTPAELGATDGRDPKLGHYASGWLVGTLAGRRAVWHPGGSLGFNTCVLRFPKEQLSVIALTNVNNGDAQGIAFKIAEAELGDPMVARAAASDQGAAPRDGRFFFRHPRTNGFLVSIVSGGRMKFASLAWDLPMRATGEASMRSVSAAIPVEARFLYDKNPADLRVRVGDQDPFVCRGLAPERVSPEDLKQLAGVWRSAEVGATLELQVSGRGLRIADELQVNPGALIALRKDLVLANEGFVIDVEYGDGKPVALRVSTGRARRIRYVRP